MTAIDPDHPAQLKVAMDAICCGHDDGTDWTLSTAGAVLRALRDYLAEQPARTELLERITALGSPDEDREAAHLDAERALLDYIDDEAVTVAWQLARQRWWYA